MKTLRLLAATALAFAAFATLAFAAGSPDCVGIPATYSNCVQNAVFVSEGSVAVPIGDYAAGIAPFLTTAIVTVVGGLITFLLDKFVGSFATANMRDAVNQLLEKAVQYGVNMAVENIPANIEVSVQNPVVAHALEYALKHGPTKLIAWMGGATMIEEKILARIKLVLPTDSPQQG